MTEINDVLREKMGFVQVSYEQYANVHRQNAPNYILNDEVCLDTRNMQTKRLSKKLSDKFDGLFPTTKIINLHVYKLELLYDWIIHPVFHTNFLKPGSDDPLPGQLTTLPPPVLIINNERQDTWEMTKILNFKYTGINFSFWWIGWGTDLTGNLSKTLLEHLKPWTNTTANILFALVMTYAKIIKTTTLMNFKTSRSSIIKKEGIVTVRIQDRIQNSIQLLIKHID